MLNDQQENYIKDLVAQICLTCNSFAVKSASPTFDVSAFKKKLAELKSSAELIQNWWPKA